MDFIERDIVESIARGQKIVMRFPPEPNGYLHIGHTKALSINHTMVKKYNGKFNLRFDDTNPEKEDIKYVKAQLEDLKWLGIEFDNILYASDYYEKLYKMAQVLIKKGLAYVDDQSADEISKNRGSLTSPGINSKFRDRAVDDNLKLFKDMRDGKFKDGECVLRAKIDMAHPNMNMRDPVMYRILREPHYRTGTTWVIYPLYDFAHPLSDAIEEISHSCCSLEYDDHRILYDWFIANAIEPTMKTPPRQFEFSRLNIEQTVMSKRHLLKYVEDGTVDGWDDPRMPTISGMRCKGYPASAIMEFTASTGVSRTPMTVPLSALEFYVRKHLEVTATRVHVVFKPLLVLVDGEELYIEQDDYSESPPAGYKRLVLGGTVRLRNKYIIRCDLHKGGILHCTRMPDDTKVKGVIHWVDTKTCVDMVVHEYLPLLVEPSLIIHKVKADPELVNAKPGEPFQFVRKGFYTKDKTGVFNKTVGQKEGF